MSWGSTGFTPIVTYNQPPFGFHEVQNPPDFPVCNSNPYIATDYLKDNINRSCDDEEDDVKKCLYESHARAKESFQLVEGFKNSSIAFFGIVIVTILAFLGANFLGNLAGEKTAPPIQQLLQKNPLFAKIAAKIPMKKLGQATTKSVPISSIVRMIVMTIAVFILTWIGNTVVNSALMYNECKRTNFKIAYETALSGAIPTAISALAVLIVLVVVGRIIVPLMIFDIMGGGSVAIATTMIIFNLIFGAGIGQVAVLKRGCSADPDATPAPTTVAP